MGWVTLDGGNEVWVNDETGRQEVPPPEEFEAKQQSLEAIAQSAEDLSTPGSYEVPDIGPDDVLRGGKVVPAAASNDPKVQTGSDTIQSFPIYPNQTVEDVKSGEPEFKVNLAHENKPLDEPSKFSLGEVSFNPTGKIPVPEAPKGPKPIGKFDVEGPSLTTQQAAADVAQSVATMQFVQDAVQAFYADPNYGPEVRQASEYISKNFDPATAKELLDGVKERVDQELAHLHSDIDNLMSQEINPNRIFKNGAGVAAAVGVAVGAMSQAILGPGTVNVAQQIIESAVQRDMQAQRLELQRNSIGAGLRKDFVQLVRQRGLDDAAAFDYLQGYARKALAAQVAKYAARDPKMAIDAAKVTKDLQARIVSSMEKANTKLTAKEFAATASSRVTEANKKTAIELASTGTTPQGTTPQITEQGVQPVPITAQPEAQRFTRPASAGRSAIGSKQAVAGKRTQAPNVGQSGQANQPASASTIPEQVPGLEPRLQGHAKATFQAAIDAGIVSFPDPETGKPEAKSLFTPITSKAGYDALQDSLIGPRNAGKLGDDVPLYVYEKGVTSLIKAARPIQRSIEINNRLREITSLIPQNNAARFASFISDNQAEVFELVSELDTIATSEVFAKAMGNELAESVAKASNLDITTMSKLKAGPASANFQEGMEEFISVLSPSEIKGWTKAMNDRFGHTLGDLQGEAGKLGVRLTPTFVETANSMAASLFRASK